jgi:hypothetical protein
VSKITSGVVTHTIGVTGGHRSHSLGATHNTMTTISAPDTLLVQRIAALGDRAALAELDARYGMTLYAIAYGLTFDRGTSDMAVAAALREAWRSAASFVIGEDTVLRWLTAFTRSAVRGWTTRMSSETGDSPA